MHDDVARAEAEQERQQRDELLRADRRQDVRGRQPGHAAAPGVPVDDRLAESGRADRLRVGVGIRRRGERLGRRPRACGSTGEPIDRSTMPSGWALARCGVRCDGVPRVVGEVGDPHVSGLRGQRDDDRVVRVDHADLGRAAGRADVVEELDVGLVVVLPLVGQVVLVVDRLDRAHRFAGTAVDALVGVDVQRAVTLVDAVDRALVDARAVLDVHTRKGDHIRHSSSLVRPAGSAMRSGHATARATRSGTEIVQTMPGSNCPSAPGDDHRAAGSAAREDAASRSSCRGRSRASPSDRR